MAFALEMQQHYTTFVKCLFDLEVLPPATTSATPASTPLQLLSNLLRPYVAANQAASSSSSSSSPSVAKSQNAQQRRELKVTLFKLERAAKNALDEYRSAARSKATTSLGGGLLATSSGLSNGVTGASSAMADGPEEPQWDLLVLPKRKSGGQEEREEDDDDEDEDTSSTFVSGLGGSSTRRSGSTGQASSIETPQSLRSYLLLLLRFHALMAYNNLSFVDDELGLLANVPASAQRDAAERQAREEAEADRRRRRGEGDVDDFRVETRFDASAPGPLMDDKGKPLRPFTITSGSNASNGNGSSAASFSNAPFRDFNERQRMRDGVFQPSHRLPTMTIDEYLEEEQRRGNVITGGGAEGAAKPTPKEERASRAEMEGSRGAEEAEEEIRREAIEWDEFKESNKRGAGNTMNRG